MSRSRKKVGGWVDRNPYMKAYANRRVRRKSVNTEIANGSSYKKMTCSYSICDWRFTFHHDCDVRRYLERWGDKRYKVFMK